MNCSYCETPLRFNHKTQKYFCPVEASNVHKNPFVNNQMLCLPFVQFVIQYPEVLTKKRFKIFDVIGYDCVTCGMIGSHIVWWREFGKRQADHYDIAGYKDGKLRMITIDHIYPKSKGGPDHIDNYQPMCSFCNGRKSDKVIIDGTNTNI